MPARHAITFVLALSLSAGACLSANAAATLKPYRGEAELNTALEAWRSQARRLQGERRREAMPAPAMSMAPAAGMVAAAPAQDSAARTSAESAVRTSAESMTNVQTAGVDEGGIVKRAGDFLVVLRRGRLFSVRVGGDTLRPTAAVEAYAPGSDPRGAWYDELLISGRTVVVIGYSYARGGTEIGLFELAADGALAYRATYHLRSFDYYSSRNYASRLVGRKLLFYTPTLLQPWGQPAAQMMPAVRLWHRAAAPGEFERILPATRIYRTGDDFDAREPLALHTVTSCELGEATLQCEASAVLGPAGRVFYVSQGAVYVWTSSTRRQPGADPGRPDMPAPLSAVFRLPLDGTAPSGLKTAGVPIDQMSFLEDGQGQLNVLLRAQGEGEGMWGAERGRGALALLRVPLAAFGDGRSAAQREHYRRLPGPGSAAVQNRYVGDWLLWGGTDGAWALRYAADAAARTQAHALAPGHAVERIEALGAHALLVGSEGSDLGFTAVRLGLAEARLEGQHLQRGAHQGETRTHGFFYRATGSEEGLLGLPLVDATGSRRPALWPRQQAAASVIFLRQRSLDFTALGELSAQPGPQADDACKASCVDWYGNARPLFIGERVFALMGYELVEGRLEARHGSERLGERLEERRRVSFAPPARGAQARPTPFD